MLYFNKTNVVSKFTNIDVENDETSKLWIFIAIILILMIIRIFLEKFIDDKPEWISNEELRRNYLYSIE